MSRRINVLQFICPTGLYGAERWILALTKHIDPSLCSFHLAVTDESPGQNLDVCTEFASLDLPTHKISMSGRFDPMSIFGLWRVVCENNIDIIHTHGYKSDIIGLIAARLTRIPCITTPHGFENSKDKKLQAFIRLGIFTLKYFNCIAPLSDDLRDNLKQAGVPAEKIRLIGNGTDLNETDHLHSRRPSSAGSANGRAKKIVYAGQLAPRKNLTDLIKAFDSLHQEDPKLTLLLIGEGPQRTYLEEFASRLSCGRAIHFLGYRKDRLKVVQACDLFCMTSSLEGIPRAMMEAMALEVPVVAYDIPGVNQLVQHEKTGLLAAFGDTRALANRCERVLSESKLSKTLAAKGREHIHKHFSANRMAREYEEMYQQLLCSGES